MSPPIPRTKRELWIALSFFAVAIFLALGFGLFDISCEAYADSVRSTCEIERDALRSDIEASSSQHTKTIARKDKTIADLNKRMKEREAFWEETYEDVRAEVSGEWCWEKKKDLEYELEMEKKDCIWRMKSAGHLRYRASGAIKKCDTCIKKNGIKKPKWSKQRPEDWESDPNWVQDIQGWTDAEIAKLND